jgi:hypothetical protein
MIGYRFLTAAEIEMTEASAFYEAATAGLGSDFLDEIRSLTFYVSTRSWADRLVTDSDKRCFTASHSA